MAQNHFPAWLEHRSWATIRPIARLIDTPVGAGEREQHLRRFHEQQPHRRGRGKNSIADSIDSSEMVHSELNRTPGVHDRGDKRERV